MKNLYFTEHSQNVTRRNGSVKESVFIGRFDYNRKRRLLRIIQNSKHTRANSLLNVIKTDYKLQHYFCIGGMK